MAEETVVEPTPTPETPTPPAPVETPPEPTQAPGRFVPVERFESAIAGKYDAIRAKEAAEAKALQLEQQLRQRDAPREDDRREAPEPRQPQVSREEIEALARQQAEAMNFNERCNVSVAEGRKAFDDFDKAIDALRAVAPTVDAQGRPMLPKNFVEAALETGEGHAVLYALGKDTSEADRIMTLSPMKQAVELARLADRLRAEATSEEESESEETAAAEVLKKAQAVSKAPPPIKAKVGSGGAAPKTPGVYDTDKDGKPLLSTDDWIRQRQEEVERNRQANGQFGVRR